MDSAFVSVHVCTMFPVDVESTNEHIRNLKNGAMYGVLYSEQDDDTNPHFLSISEASAQPRSKTQRQQRSDSNGATAPAPATVPLWSHVIIQI